MFWNNVIKSRGCWTYKRTSVRGYGKIKAYGRHMRAHRFVWELTNGPIPAGLLVCHSCDNPACVRPDHLFLGTNADNNRDMWAKGRANPSGPKNRARGERSNRTILKDDDIRRIRQLRVAGLSQQKIADEIGVHQTQVSRIVRHVAWAHVS